MENVKAGDDVAICTHHNGMSAAKVERLTKTQIIVMATGAMGQKYERRFNRGTGRAVGCDSWDTPRLEPMTDALRQKMTAQALRSWAKHKATGELLALTPEQIAEVRALVRKLSAQEGKE